MYGPGTWILRQQAEGEGAGSTGYVGLADMGSSRDQIVRLRQRLRAELDDQWFLWTDTSAPPGYPVGMGAALAQYIRKVELPCPLEVNREVWRRAI